MGNWEANIRKVVPYVPEGLVAMQSAPLSSLS